MKNNELRGVKEVYKFTIEQTFKNKSFRVLLLILCLIALLSMPVVELINNGINKGEPKTSDISKVYIVDETDMPEIDYNKIKKDNSIYSNISFEYTDRPSEEVEEEIKENNNGTILLHISSKDHVYNMKFVRTPEGNVSEMDLMEISDYIYDIFRSNLFINRGVSDEQLAIIEEPIVIDVQTYTDLGVEEEVSFAVEYGEYFLLLGALLFVMMLIQYGGQSVASSIVTEKATKLIEILLTSVRPMAIIVGKVFGMLTVTLIQLFLLALSFGMSCIIYFNLFNTGRYIPESFANIIDQGLIQNFTPISLIVAILIFILGFIFFGFLAGLTGATVSKVEELQEGMVIYSTVTIVGVYMAMALIIMGLIGYTPTAFAYVTLLLPISSVFITPIYLLIGKIGLGVALAAAAILVVSIVLLAQLTSKVYQTLILHQGNVVKIKDFISILKISEEAR